jgi:hypothetical protein
MIDQDDADTILVERLEQVLDRIRKIQRAIKGVGGRPSQLEIAELKELGQEYAEIVGLLEPRQG